MENCIVAAYADNRNNWNRLARPNPLYTTFGLPTVRIAPFSGAFDHARLHTMALIYSAARVGNYDQDRKEVWPLATLEVAAPLLPHTVIRHPNDARAALVRAVLGMCMPRTWEMISEHLEAGATFANTVLPHVRNNMTYSRLELAEDQRATVDMFTWARAPEQIPAGQAPPPALTPVNAMAILHRVATRANDAALNAHLKMTMLSVVALGKQGTVTQAFLLNLRRQISGELRIDVTITADEVRSIFNTIRTSVTRETATRVIQYWMALVPQQCLRLRLTIDHMCGSGLTVYSIISKALRSFVDFPWPVVFGWLATEVEAYRAALQAVGNNAAGGYEQNRQAWASNKMRGLAFVSSELLKFSGEGSLANYGGIQAGVPMEARLRAMVRAYIDGGIDAYMNDHNWVATEARTQEYADLRQQAPAELVLPQLADAHELVRTDRPQGVGEAAYPAAENIDLA